MKNTLKILAIIVAVLVVIVVAIPFFIDANTFRPTLETDLTGALGRQVKLGNLSLSILSGSVSADDISIADDPQFSKSAFVQAKSLKVGVELIPLIFSKTLNVTELTLKQPEISLVKSENGEKWNFSSLGGNNTSAPKPAASAPASGNPNLTVAKLNISDGRLTVSRAGSTGKPRVYDKVDIEVSNFSFASSFPFQMTAQLPDDGSLKLEGNAGPIDANNAAMTRLDAKVTVKKMNLAESGFIDPAAGIAGVADYDGSVNSDGHEAKTEGKLTVMNLKVVQKGSPAGRPVEVTYTVRHDLAKETGSIPQCEIAMGKAVAHVTGTYDAHGKVTSVDLKLNAQAMPVDDLEAMLPALGVVLPPKATLKGGELSTNMTIAGPVDKLVTTGTIHLENSTLANFDLGSKLSAVSALSGKKTGNDMVIQNFSSDVRVAPEGTKADNINLNVPSLGVLTGAGTVSPANELAFKMNAALGGMGIPFNVEGTTADPKFVPDVKGMATGLLKGLTGKGNGSQNPASSVMGLFKKKP
ncbi:MAG TPA: AsmA family protein [Candidatus Sulfotelmatobacter sp.]|nr:AsmA family protein [Candidatus Sulfotelmatobacter sp.]